jgi:hypothetical protein
MSARLKRGRAAVFPKNPNSTLSLLPETFGHYQTHSMKPLSTKFVWLSSALLFALLFSEKSAGLNLLLYEGALLGWLFFSKQIHWSPGILRFLLPVQILTLCFTVWHHSTWSYFVHFIVSALFISALAAPGMRSLVLIGWQALSNLAGSYKQLFSSREDPETKKRGMLSRVWRTLRIILWPLLILLFFLFLYGLANPSFDSFVGLIYAHIGWFFRTLLNSLNFTFVGCLILGGALGVYIFYRKRHEVSAQADLLAQDAQIRSKKQGRRFRVRGLLHEYRSGVFLFTALNLALLLLNILDIQHVWIDFRWEGQYLQDFVHQGTYALIFAILLSVALVLYYFNGNLSFYSKNKNLKVLCYIWLGQNIFLALSTGLRNWYYIQYYSLAYKRIAVAFFLVLAIYGLYSVLVKVLRTKSTFYLLRVNAMAWVIVLVVSAGFNWDRLIATYNFGKGEGAFVHLNFLVELSDSALPELDQPMYKLEKIHHFQERTFFDGSLSSEGYRALYLSPNAYVKMIAARKILFKKRWEEKSWLEWNYAEARAYAILFP